MVLRVLVLGLMTLSSLAPAADWPMWRCDAGHTGSTPEPLPQYLSVRWKLQLPPLDRAWPDDERLEFDIAYEPVVAGSLLYIGSPQNDSVAAYDAATGNRAWVFYTDAPVRFAPAVAEGRVYAGSDDGCLYCLDAVSGALHWRYKAALSDRKVLGNTRMMSVWPVRGAPVLADGMVYFAAGIWPFEGVCVYALDAGTGAVAWMNDNCDVNFMVQPHRKPAFSALAPQGYLAVAGDRLLVPNGRAPAACLDRKTGKLLYYELDPNNRFGDYRIAARAPFYVNPGALYELETGRNLGAFSSAVAIGERAIVGVNHGRLRAFDFASIQTQDFVDEKKRLRGKWEAAELWSHDGPADNVILAGNRVYACREGALYALETPPDGAPPVVVWEARLEGRPVRLAAANGRLFASTLEGALYCLDAQPNPPSGAASTAKPAEIDDDARAQANEIAQATGISEGYVLILGAGDGGLAAALAGASQVRVVGITASQEETAAARARLDAAGLYGSRVAIFQADPANLDLPPYFANLAVVAETGRPFVATNENIARLYSWLRPYGGAACIAGVDAAVLTKAAGDLNLAGAQVEQHGARVLLRRTGPLPGAADWTHQYADSANSCVSQDACVRMPLGLLWFGGSSNKDILPRHGHGPSEHVIGGRLFIEGPDAIRALDVYTGRVLWQAVLPEIGKAYDNTSHQPGANALGSNYASAADGVYVAYGAKCLQLDSVTGNMVKELTLPVPEGATEAPDFGYIAIWEDVLVAGSGPLRYDEEIKGRTWNAVASKRIVALNRHTGAVLWSRAAAAAFRHNAIALGGGKVFCLDRATDELREHLARRGTDLPQGGLVIALDVRTGAELWRADKEVFGTWLGYSQQHDLLLQAGRASGDMLKDEAEDRMAVHRGADGTLLWDRQMEYDGPCMLHGEVIIAQRRLFSLLTGDIVKRMDPLTGAPLDMTWDRQHGCNTAIASRNLVTFRSSAAGFFDLEHDGGTGNLGGFRSGCTSNLIAADGVLNAPDYTRTCTCSYQIQTSLALVHRPEVEMWTYNAFQPGPGRIRRLGVNFGAPGDRRDAHGTLWLEHPSVGGESPHVSVVTEPPEVICYRYHSLRVTGSGPAWVAASGVKGLTRTVITLAEGAMDTAPYTVRLVFAEPAESEPGRRIFDVALQGQVVLAGLDITAETGGLFRTLVKEFRDIAVRDALEITLTPRDGADTLLSGVELVVQE